MRKNIQDMTMPKVVEKGQSDYATAPPIYSNSANLEFSENEISEKTQDQEAINNKIEISKSNMCERNERKKFYRCAYNEEKIFHTQIGHSEKCEIKQEASEENAEESNEDFSYNEKVSTPNVLRENTESIGVTEAEGEKEKRHRKYEQHGKQGTFREKIGIRLEKIVPPGSDLKSVKKTFIAFSIVFLGIGLLSSLLTYGQYYWELFETTQHGKSVIPGAEMPDINYIIFGKFKGIYVMLALGIVLIINNCRSFISETKSIYVMMRLKSRNELIKRCFALPLILVAVSILIMLLELLIVYLVYILATPPECLPEVISMNIWEAVKW